MYVVIRDFRVTNQSASSCFVDVVDTLKYFKVLHFYARYLMCNESNIEKLVINNFHRNRK